MRHPPLYNYLYPNTRGILSEYERIKAKKPFKILDERDKRQVRELFLRGINRWEFERGGYNNMSIPYVITKMGSAGINGRVLLPFFDLPEEFRESSIGIEELARVRKEEITSELSFGRVFVARGRFVLDYGIPEEFALLNGQEESS